MTISQRLQQAQTALGNISDAPRLDAERIAQHVLGQPEASWLHAYGKETLNAKQQEEFDRLVSERAKGKPLAYVLGEWEFYGRAFYVTEDVLVPRPSTEELVSATLPYIDVWRGKHPGEQMTIADVGTGSGIIAVTLALEFTSPARKPSDLSFSRRGASPYKGEAGRLRTDEVHFLATDVSPTALEVATKNARRHGVEDRIEFLHGDMLVPLRSKKIDLIISNPPYIPTAELNQIPNPVRNLGLQFEPQMALDGGADGQKYLQIIQDSGLPAIVEGTGGKILKFNI